MLKAPHTHTHTELISGCYQGCVQSDVVCVSRSNTACTSCSQCRSVLLI